jgi:DNA-binding CsgD family transcriptional regulator
MDGWEGDTKDLVRVSPRQREILQLVARGQANKEIARALNISRRTVEAHLKELYQKAGVHRRAALVAWWLRQTTPDG